MGNRKITTLERVVRGAWLGTIPTLEMHGTRPAAARFIEDKRRCGSSREHHRPYEDATFADRTQL